MIEKQPETLMGWLPIESNRGRPKLYLYGPIPTMFSREVRARVSKAEVPQDDWDWAAAGQEGRAYNLRAAQAAALAALEDAALRQEQDGTG